MEQGRPVKKRTHLYRLLALGLVSWVLLGAVAALGTWKVKAVAAEVEAKLKERSAQEKLVVLVKVTLQQCRTTLLESILSRGDAPQLQRLRQEYQEGSASFEEYCEVLSEGDATMGIAPPPRGSELEQKIIRLKESWRGFQQVAFRLLPPKGRGTAPAADVPAAAGVKQAQHEIDSATSKVDGAIDEVLVTVGDLASGTKQEVATIQHHASLALLSSVLLAALLTLLGIWRSIEAQRTRELVMRHNGELQQQSAKLRTLYEISRTAGQTMDLGELLDSVLKVLSEVGLCPHQLKAAIYLVDGDELQLASSTGCPPGAVGERVAIAKSPAYAAVLGGKVGVGRDGHWESPACLGEDVGHGHVLVPIGTANAPVGVLDLIVPVGVDCDEEMRQMLASVGSQLGVAISNARLYQQTRSEALHDTLTGLPNRRFMDQELKRAIALSVRHQTPLSLVMLDIDHFKRLNDTQGHTEGDRILALVAKTVARTFRSTDQLFRYGGEEFLALLPETDHDTACQAAERVRQAVERECGVTVSLGVAACRPSDDRESLVGRADQALYRAKHNGRNRVEFTG
jgi:diguanylate cyclase (GGDEF)-like protein